MKAHYILFALFLFTVVSTSCNKEEDTIAVVRILTSQGLPVEGVSVRLYAEPSDIQTNELIDEVARTSDAAGEAIFDFTELYEQGQAGFAVLNIEAILDTNTVEGIIKIEPEEVSEKELILY
jgi:hypothetical protein